MLILCDEARAALRATKSLGPNGAKISRMLEVIVKDEERGAPCIAFSTVLFARLDKLVADLLDPAFRPSPIPLRFRVDLSIADALQRL